MADECLDEFNERTTIVVTVNFTDENGDPVTPTAATVRIDDQKRRTVIRAQESIDSLDDTVDIEITSDENYLIRPRAKYEVRTVTVEFDYGGDKHGSSEYKYKLLGLYGVVDVPSASVSPSASASPST